MKPEITTERDHLRKINKVLLKAAKRSEPYLHFIRPLNNIEKDRLMLHQAIAAAEGTEVKP